MKRLLLILLVCAACEGKLSDEQRKKMRDKMQTEELKRVPEARLLEASFERGRVLASLVQKKDPGLQNAKLLDSLQHYYHAKIFFLLPNDSMSASVEKQIIEAYVAGAGKVDLADNVQKIGSDSMLYTKPILITRPDSTVEFTKALGIRMSKKEIVLSIKD